MCKTTIYHFFLAILLMLLPISTVAQQANDIKKPTRSRVTEKDKNNTEQKTAKSKDNKNDNKAADKKDNKAPEKKDNKVPEKPIPVKEEKAPVKQEPAKPVTDTTAKPATPPKPKKEVDPSKVQYDGIDISKHQGSINWEELRKNTKIKFVYIKASEGSNHVDSKYKENIRNARKHGFKVGSYHFFRTTSSARTQAINFLQTANRDEQDLIPVIDVEENKNWSRDRLRDSVKVFVDIVEDYYGCKPMIYASETFFNRHLGLAFKEYPLFIAKYSDVSPNVNIKWILWQFSESGKFRAVRENLVDMSRFNKGFTIENILYKPGKARPKSSIKDIVDHKDAPKSVNMTTEQKPAPAKSKREIEEEKRKAEKEKKVNERNKRIAEEEAKKKAEADKKAKEKAKEKAEQVKKEKARQAAREEAAKKEAEAKAKRKAEAAKAREQKAKQQEAAKKNNNKSANLLNTTSSKLSQSQRNDSIRNAKLKGRKTNKSSADND